MPLNPVSKTYLNNLRADPSFQALLKDLKEQRPQIRIYDPESDNANGVVRDRTLAQGFDICMAYLEQK